MADATIILYTAFYAVIPYIVVAAVFYLGNVK